MFKNLRHLILEIWSRDLDAETVKMDIIKQLRIKPSTIYEIHDLFSLFNYDKDTLQRVSNKRVIFTNLYHVLKQMQQEKIIGRYLHRDDPTFYLIRNNLDA